MVPLAILLLTQIPTAQAGTWSFEGRKYYEPLIAGVREPQIGALALARATRMNFMVRNNSPRRVWDIDVGAELPLAGWESEDSVQGRVPSGATGIGLWVPIDLHVIEDFVDDSAPIVNTDYRFGVMAKLQRGLRQGEWLGVRIFVGHESTHLGDEFSIVGRRTFPRSFERVNVSWEYLDVGALYERQAWSVRAGVTSTLPFGDSYYQVGPGTITESPLGVVTESQNSVDPYVGADREFQTEFFIDRNGVGYLIYGSTEVRWRTIYDYHKVRPDAAEQRQVSGNVIVGLRKAGDAKGLGRASPFVRYYHGVNPHGQFRNQKNYTEIGIGVRLVH
jgi:hypothetical protein